MKNTCIFVLMALTMSVAFSNCVRIHFDPQSSEFSLDESSFPYEISDYDDARYLQGDATLEDQVTEIEVDWPVGEVELVSVDDTRLSVSETARHAIPDTMAMRYRLDGGGRLKVYFCPPCTLDSKQMDLLQKKLVVSVPRQLRLDGVMVNGVGSDVKVAGLAADKLKIETISGDIKVSGSDIAQAELTTVSGDMELRQLKSDHARVNSVSGDMLVKVYEGEQLEVHTTSGDIDLGQLKTNNTLVNSVSGDIKFDTDNGDWNVTWNTVSGEASCSRPAVVKNGIYVLGQGTSLMTCSTTSGDIAIR